ncbi:MAG: TetR/AcrR family transcriptional regulator [Treponema sp.]|jgi:AcrR family transcriptional regulator|nr:TetR/AcrR family transcriptional regulator [Treponema sp.]
MAIVVEHDKRRKDILKRALDVFVDEGFEDATFQKIADRCGITRTTLYIYFKNKKEIFNYSIKQFLLTVEADLTKIRCGAGLTTADKLIRVLSRIIDLLEKNRRLLTVILDYLRHLSGTNGDPNYRVRRRTLRLRHILATMVIDGIKAGEIVPVDVKAADDLLYPLIESAIFRLTVLKQETVTDLKNSAALAVRLMTVNRNVTRDAPAIPGAIE